MTHRAEIYDRLMEKLAPLASESRDNAVREALDGNVLIYVDEECCLLAPYEGERGERGEMLHLRNVSSKVLEFFFHSSWVPNSPKSALEKLAECA